MGGVIAKKEGVDGIQFADSFLSNEQLLEQCLSFDFLFTAISKMKMFGGEEFHFVFSTSKVSISNFDSVQPVVMSKDLKSATLVEWRHATFNVIVEALKHFLAKRKS